MKKINFLFFVFFMTLVNNIICKQITLINNTSATVWPGFKLKGEQNDYYWGHANITTSIIHPKEQKTITLGVIIDKMYGKTDYNEASTFIVTGESKTCERSVDYSLDLTCDESNSLDVIDDAIYKVTLIGKKLKLEKIN